MNGALKDKLTRGEVVYGQMILELFTPGIGQMLANSGLEFVIFDMEHGRCDIGLASEMIASCRGAGIVPMVRVPDLNTCPLSRFLDLGARGVMVPRVETGEQMRDIVAQLKYAPQGRRGVALGLAHDGYNPQGATYFERANRETIVIALVETVRGFENLDEIVATPGLDIAWMGHFDLTVSMGIPAQFQHPRFLDAMDRLAGACRRYAVAPGFLPATPADAAHWISRGFRVLSLGTDFGVYQTAMRSFLEETRTAAAAQSGTSAA
jgi:2-keto-3-deoxy-L-rhamnonate aldolase RhmA